MGVWRVIVARNPKPINKAGSKAFDFCAPLPSSPFLFRPFLQRGPPPASTGKSAPVAWPGSYECPIAEGAEPPIYYVGLAIPHLSALVMPRPFRMLLLLLAAATMTATTFCGHDHDHDCCCYGSGCCHMHGPNGLAFLVSNRRPAPQSVAKIACIFMLYAPYPVILHLHYSHSSLNLKSPGAWQRGLVCLCA